MPLYLNKNFWQAINLIWLNFLKVDPQVIEKHVIKNTAQVIKGVLIFLSF